MNEYNNLILAVAMMSYLNNKLNNENDKYEE